jgi:hypothetical protein
VLKIGNNKSQRLISTPTHFTAWQIWEPSDLLSHDFDWVVT